MNVTANPLKATPHSVLVALLISSSAACGQSFSITNITVPGAVSLSVASMNGSGHVAGYCYTPNSEQRAFYWSDGVGQDLGTLGGTTSVGNCLNNFGQVAGYSSSVGDTEFHAFSGIGLTLFDLGTLGGPVSTANWISDAGHVTGYSFVSALSIDSRAFVTPNSGVLQDLGTLGGSFSSGSVVNNHGQVAGDSTTAGDSETHAFLYNGSSLVDLGTLGGTYSRANALNDAGQVAGESTLAGEAATHAFLFDGTLHDLGSLGGTYSTAYEINDAGQVIGDSFLAGDSEYHGFIYSAGTMTDLGTLGGGFSSAWSINSAGQVVGISSNSLGQVRAFLWHNGTMLDLNSVLPPNSGWELTAAHFINDNGQIAGAGRLHGQDAWYLLSPRATENQPPVANAGNDQNVGCGSLTLDGSASSDPDGDELRYAWSEGGVLLGTTAVLNVSLTPGSHTLTLRVTDSQDAASEDTVVVSVGDQTGPAVVCPADHAASTGERGLASVPDLLANLVATDNCTEPAALVKTQTPAAGSAVGCGSHRVVLTVTDAAGNTTTCTVGFTVSDTTAPDLHYPAEIILRGRSNCLALVPDLSRRVRVRDNCTPREQLAFVQDPAPGTLVSDNREVRLSVSDQAGNTAHCVVLVRVVDPCPPRIRSLTADPQLLQPVNRKMVKVKLSAVVTDNCTSRPHCRIVSVSSNQPVTGQSDKTAPDWNVTGNMTLELRAESTGQTARVYTIRVAATDEAGNTNYRKVQVRVPRQDKD